MSDFSAYYGREHHIDVFYHCVHQRIFCSGVLRGSGSGLLEWMFFCEEDFAGTTEHSQGLAYGDQKLKFTLPSFSIVAKSEWYLCDVNIKCSEVHQQFIGTGKPGTLDNGVAESFKCLPNKCRPVSAKSTGIICDSGERKI